MNVLRQALVGCGILAAVASARADAPGVTVPSDSIIAARQASFTLMAGNFAAMKAAVDAGAEVKPFATGAKAIGMWARAMPGMFPLGTEKGHDTQAKPEAFTDAAGFKRASQALLDASNRLLQVAQADDKAGFANEFKATAKACAECHRSYRVRQPGE